jgi:uncharacterized protein (TIGR03435 family)
MMAPKSEEHRMKQIMLCYGFLVLSQGNGVAQCQGNGPAFEVASVKPAVLAAGDTPGKNCTGGPGTSDPENFRCSCSPLAAVLVRAYGISFTDLRAPDWVSWTPTCYDIAEKVPSGTSKEQFQVMLQNLLCERFHLLVHHEIKMLPSYTLSIGKAGSTLRAHSSLAASESSTAVPSNSNSAPADGRPGTFTWVDTHHLRLTANNLDIKSLARMLAQVMQEPVVDETGLAGGYDLSWISRHRNSWPEAEMTRTRFLTFLQSCGSLVSTSAKKMPRET